MPKLEVVNANNVIEFSPQKANFKLKNTGGPKGEPGAQGPKGDTGPQGPAGPQGIQGEKGDKGAQGERGPQGIQGPQGPQGIQGPKGDKGDKGNTGATGPQGPQGPAGQDGADGTDGFSPIATVTQEGLDAEISITDKNGTTTATVPGFGVQTVTTLPATGTENIIYLKRTESTASGKTISISDAVNAPIASFQLDGETSQQTYTGKNLCGIPDQTFNWQGVDVTIKNGEITMNGTSTGTGTKNISPIKTTTFNGSYTTNLIYVSGTAGSGNFNLRKASDSTVIQGTQTTFASSNSRVSYTITSTDVIFGLYILSVGSVFTNYKFKVQIVAGSTADYNFEPYVGGVPAPNPDYPQAVQTVTGENVVKITDGQGAEQSYEVNLGKNLFDKDNAAQILDDLYINTSAQKIDDNGGAGTGTIFISCLPNTTYTVSKILSSRFILGTTAELPADEVAVSGILTGNDQTSVTITTGSDAKYLCVYYRRSASDSVTKQQLLDSIQIELGSTATTYAPYFTPIELCKIGGYQDYIYKSGDKWYVHKEIGHTLYTGNVLGIAANQGSGETTVSATGAFFIWVGYVGLMSENLGTLNDGAISGNADANAMTSGTFATRSGTPDRLYFRNTAYIGKTGNEMKAILEGNIGGASVWYALATPTDTEITNATLVGQLEAILSAGQTYAGTTNITTVIATGNEQGTLEIGYYNAYDSYLYVNGRWEQFARLTAADEQ